MTEPYTPYDYNKHNVLKVPVALYAAMVYLCKYLILFVVPRLPRVSRDDSLAFLENNDVTRTDLGLLIAGLPAMAVLLVAVVRRAPDAAGLWRRIWSSGRILLAASAGIEFILLTAYVLTGKRELDGVVVAFGYVDLMILIYLLRSRRVIDVFGDFPATATKASPTPAAPDSGKRSAPAVPLILVNSRLAIVHLGGPGLLEYHREIIIGIYSALSALGHDVVISPDFVHANRVNLIVGFDRAQSSTRAQMLEKNIDYLVYETGALLAGRPATREGTPLDIEGDYLPALAAAKAVISPYRQVVRALAAEQIEARYVRWGHVPELEDAPPLAADRRDFDAWFFGEITPARKARLQALVDLGVRVKASAPPAALPAFLRNHYLSRSKLVLSLQRGDAQALVNPWRIMYALQNGYCVVTERQDADYDHYNAYGLEVDGAELVNRCKGLLDSGDYLRACNDKRELLLSEPLTENLKGVV